MAHSGQANQCWASTPEAFAPRSSAKVVPFGSAPDTDAVSGPDRAAGRTSATCQRRLRASIRRDPLDHPACRGVVVRRRPRGRSPQARPQGDRRGPRLRAVRVRSRRHGAAHHRRHRRVPRLAVGTRRCSATGGASSPSPRGSRRPTRSASRAVLVGTLSVAAVAMVIAFPLALLTALFISEYAPRRHEVDPDLAGRPDGRRPVDHLRDCGASSWSCRTPPHSRCGCSRTSAGSPSSRSSPTRTPLSGTQSRYIGSAFCAGIAVADDGAADVVRGDAPGLLPDPGRGEGGRARARLHPLGHGPHRRHARSAAAASSAARCSGSAGRSARPSPYS